MYRSVYDLKSFYNSRVGRVVRRVLQSHIRELWPNVKGMRIMGCGYANPYLRVFMDEAERVFGVMPAGQGAHYWPQTGMEKNLICLSEEGELPFENSSIDLIFLVHSLEYTELLQPTLQELWRVLKANGRLLVIVPNRSGFWARADWSPFGQGTPYSVSQLCYYLRDNSFIHERTKDALYLPAFRNGLLMKFAGLFERYGPYVLPFAAGVHMVEASKQLFAGADKCSGSKVRVRGRDFLPRPVPQGMSSFKNLKNR